MTAAASVCLALLTIVSVGPASAEVLFVQDAQHQTVRVRRLTDPSPDCGYVSFSGRIAQRAFSRDGLTPESFILESNDGTRMFINVFVPQIADRFSRGAILSGLQRLSRVGRQAIGQVQVCGSGPILTLDLIQ